jgi:hypothetical protein
MIIADLVMHVKEDNNSKSSKTSHKSSKNYIGKTIYEMGT